MHHRVAITLLALGAVAATSACKDQAPIPHSATHLVIVSGTDQAGDVSAPLAKPLVVQAFDAGNRAVGGVPPLAELLEDPRQPAIRRYLRKLYPDPFGGGQWGLVKAPDGGIAGVYSMSSAKPLKSGNFRAREAAFSEAQRYADWKFVYSPVAPPAAAATRR